MEKEIKQEIRELRKYMKENNIRTISCFNGGLTSEERRCNSELFRLKALLTTNRN